MRKQLHKHNRLIKNLVAAAEGVYQPIGRESVLLEQLNDNHGVSRRLVHLVEQLESDFTQHAHLFSSLVQTVLGS